MKLDCFFCCFFYLRGSSSVKVCNPNNAAAMRSVVQFSQLIFIYYLYSTGLPREALDCQFHRWVFHINVCLLPCWTMFSITRTIFSIKEVHMLLQKRANSSNHNLTLCFASQEQTQTSLHLELRNIWSLAVSSQKKKKSVTRIHSSCIRYQILNPI